jgi:hypothetical protein
MTEQWVLGLSSFVGALLGGLFTGWLSNKLRSRRHERWRMSSRDASEPDHATR